MFKVIIFLTLSFILPLLVAISAPLFIPYLGFFPYKELLSSFQLPQYLYSFANFDGLHYILIAQNGYSQYEQAFFPLYPLTIRVFSFLFSYNYLVAGLVISNICFIVGLYFFQKVLESIDLHENQINRTIYMLLLFPTSFFFHSLYTESIFFLLVVVFLYFFKKEKYLLSGLFGFLASLTRLVGVFLTIPLFLTLVDLFQQSKKNHRSVNTRVLLQIITSIFFTIGGLLSYCLYLWHTTGDPFMFFTSQKYFGANRSDHIILLPQVIYRYLKIFFLASFDYRYFISLLEFFIFGIVLSLLLFSMYKLYKSNSSKHRVFLNGLALFSLANLILPTLTGTFSSIPRYALMSLTFFITFGSLQNKLLQYICLFLSFILYVVLFGYFLQGYFVS